MRLFLFVTLLISTFTLNAKDDEIFVQLASEVELIPLYVSTVESEEVTLPQRYPEAIRQVLLFDMNHNGVTKTVQKSDGTLYQILLTIKKNELIASVVSVNAQTKNTIDHIYLTGELNKDRTKIHQLADSIHKLLFKKSGIASCKILYTVKKKVERQNQEPRWASEVFVSDYDGHNARPLTNDGTLVANPIFLPKNEGGNSGQFLYVSYKIGQPKMFVGSLSQSSPKRVSSLKANQVTPSVNPNGTLIAFSSDVTGRADIFLQPLDQESKPIRIYSAKGTANASPTFSPDGKKIAFVSNKDGSPKVYVMKIPPAGTNPEKISLQLISKRNRENSAPCWSPDGKKLAYCAKNNGPRQIWIYDFDTGSERELTQGKADKENPTWAQDSLHLLFNGKDSHGTEIYLINLNQPEAVKITSGSGDKFFPSWEPKTLQ